MQLEIEQSDIQGIINYVLRNKPSDLFLLDIARYIVGKRRFNEAKSHGTLSQLASVLDQFLEGVI